MSKQGSLISELDQNFQRAFASDSGRIVLEELKKNLHYGENLYHLGQSNQDLHYLAGRQSVINDIMFILNKGKK